jgi:hypothetical protein
LASINNSPRTRRAILGAALGAAAASVATAVGRPAATSAANGDHIVIGSTSNSGTANTALTTTSAIALGLTGATSGLQANGTLSGMQGVASAAGGIGAAGYSNGATGSGIGVLGTATSPDGIGVKALSNGSSTGLFAASTPPGTQLPLPADKTAVYAWVNEAGARGVVGRSDAGTGVLGGSNDTTGVEGSTFGGTGVYGHANAGVGVKAQAEAIFGGTALQVEGVAVFSRAGRASVAANATSVDVTVPGGLGANAFVIATLQTYRTGVWVTVARKNYPAAGKVRIYLNKVASTTTSTAVGWMVIG